MSYYIIIIYTVLFFLNITVAIAFIHYVLAFFNLSKSEVKKVHKNLIIQIGITISLCLIDFLWILFFLYVYKKIYYFFVFLLIFYFIYMIKTFFTIKKLSYKEETVKKL